MATKNIYKQKFLISFGCKNLTMKKIYSISVIRIENTKTLKYHTFSIKKEH